MPRHRHGQCTLCGDWIPYPYKGRKCPPCRSPKVREARKALREARKADRDEVVIREESL